jgi:hypothetical protein
LQAGRWKKLCEIIDPFTSATYEEVKEIEMAGRGERGEAETELLSVSDDDSDDDFEAIRNAAAARGSARAGSADPDPGGSAAGPAASSGGRTRSVDPALDGIVNDSHLYSDGATLMPSEEERLRLIADLHKRLEKYHAEAYRTNQLKDAQDKYARGEGHLVPFDAAKAKAFRRVPAPKRPDPAERAAALEEQRKKVIARFDAEKDAAVATRPSGLMGGRDTFPVDASVNFPPWLVDTVGSLGVKEGPRFDVPRGIMEELMARGLLPQFLDEAAAVLEAPPAAKVVGWAGIEGLDLVKEKLAVSLIIPQNNPQLYDGVLSVNRNFLFWGPPGTGKTVVARRVAQLSHSVFVNVTAAWLMRGVQNEVAQRINALYAICRKLEQPVVIFIDEADEVIQRRGTSRHADKAVTAFLTNLEQSEHPEPVYTIFATNFPKNVDDAIMSRIGMSIPLWLPSRDVRYKRFEKELQKGYDEGLVTDEVMTAAFLAECVDKSLWFSNRDITNCVRALYVSIQVKYLEQIDMATTDLGALKIKKKDLPALTREDVLDGIAGEKNSREVSQKAYAWAVSAGVPVAKYVPAEYRKTLTQTKAGFAAYLV